MSRDEQTRVAYIRMPASLHEFLKKEAKLRKFLHDTDNDTLNKLCIHQLAKLQPRKSDAPGT